MRAINGLTARGYTRTDEESDEARFRAIREQRKAESLQEQAEAERKIRRTVLLKQIAAMQARETERQG